MPKLFSHLTTSSPPLQSQLLLQSLISCQEDKVIHKVSFVPCLKKNKNLVFEQSLPKAALINLAGITNMFHYSVSGLLQDRPNDNQDKTLHQIPLLCFIWLIITKNTFSPHLDMVEKGYRVLLVSHNKALLHPIQN